MSSLESKPLLPKIPREQVSRILSNYHLKAILDAIPDTTLEKIIRDEVIPLEITTLAHAKEEIFKRTGLPVDSFGISQEHQQEIWYWCMEYINELSK